MMLDLCFVPRRLQRPLRLLLIASAAAVASPAIAQLTTGTIRGSVTASAKPSAGATIVAVDVSSGFTSRATAGPSGSYVLPGLRPGTYDVTVTGDGQTAKRRVTIGVGQAATLDIDTTPPDPAADAGPEIVVTGTVLAETRTSEIATNITTRQIENLPQANRNFLNFADLAPGVRASKNERRRTFSGGGVGEKPEGESLASPQVNVFIDGISLKSNVQQGGLVGGDSSAGNPFPQAAIQEFRVLTSNFKAEYEDAGVSAITAVTKTGGNEFRGDVFFSYQDDALREKDGLEKLRGFPKGKFTQKQYGASLGGPIIEDKLNFFIAYEGNDQDTNTEVVIGSRTPANLAQFGQFEGQFGIPFREDLGFAKLTLQLDDDNKFDLTGSIRVEDEIAGFGGGTSQEAASINANDVYTGSLKWQHTRGDFLNEASVDYLYYQFETAALNPDLVGRDFQGVARVGGRDTTQRVVQKGLTFRDSMTFSNVEALGGTHNIKLGGKVSFQDYTVTNRIAGNPLFSFRIDASRGQDFSAPFEARYGVGQPTITAKTEQFGIYVQDDWEATDKLTLNLGLRYDYETNAKNDDYVTPAAAVTALRTLETALAAQGSDFNADDYISTGNNRKPYSKAIQPRIGLSYDLFDDQRTVFFGGFGRYFDRTLFRNAAEESLLQTYISRTFLFSRDGLPRDGQPTILFNPSFLSAAGLDGLIAQSLAPGGELRIIPNNTRPPQTDQYSIGIRQKIGRVQTALSYTHIDAKRQAGYFPVNRSVARNAEGFLDFIPVPGYGQVVALSQDRESRYDGVFLTIDKPYTAASGWSFNLAYTLAFAKERGYDFNFDFPDIANQPFRPNAGDERHRVVISGLVELPWGFQLSGLATFADNQPFFVTDASNGFGENVVLSNVGNSKDFRQVDLRLTKSFRFGGGAEDAADDEGARLQLIAEVFNLFDRANYSGFDGFIGPEGNDNFGAPNALNGPPRSFQFGVRFTF